MLSAVRKTAVLVVEDDPGLRGFYRTSLTVEGYAVHIVQDGLDALHYIEGHDAPDVIILDLDLPRVSGHDVYQELAAHTATSNIPIVVVTGADTSKHKLDVGNLACILRKPITVEALI